MALAAAASSLLAGPAIDQLRPERKLLALALPLLMMCLALSALSLVRMRWQLPAAGALLGVFQGTHSCARSVLPAALFGRKHLGAVQASLYTHYGTACYARTHTHTRLIAVQASLYVSAQLSSAAGSFILGLTKERLGSFLPVLAALIALNGLLCLALCAHVLKPFGGNRNRAGGTAIAEASHVRELAAG